jgi:hypothetical protein
MTVNYPIQVFLPAKSSALAPYLQSEWLVNHIPTMARYGTQLPNLSARHLPKKKHHQETKKRQQEKEKEKEKDKLTSPYTPSPRSQNTAQSSDSHAAHTSPPSAPYSTPSDSADPPKHS